MFRVRTLAGIVSIMFAFVAGSGLRDASIAADTLQYLDGGSWVVVGSGTDAPAPFGAQVPGDLITDMERAGIVADPLVDNNFLLPLWDVRDFTYSTTFVANEAVVALNTVFLVLDGIKMVADITFNGISLGFIDNSFLRFSYDISSIVSRTGEPNVLAVAFTTSNDTRNKPGRWSACSGGWDWAPISNTMVSPGDPFGDLATFSKGIW